MKMSERERFSNEIMNFDKGMPKGMTDCEKFGMTWGCKEDCPQLQRGECEIYKDVDGFLKDED